ATDFCVMEADSSQLSAVRAASGGESFVLQGPPGTGKSQTITNIIAQCMAEDRNVLFVAEKQAALEVVYRRLENVDLDDFSLKLHAESANKQDVVRQLGQALRSAETRAQSEWERLVAKLEDVREPIDEYVDAVHRERSAGLSLYQAVSRLTELAEAPEVSIDLGRDVQQLTRERREAIEEAAERLSQFGREVAPVAGHPLRLFESVPPPDSTKPWELGHHAETLAKIAERPPGGRALIAEPDWDVWRNRLRQATEKARLYRQKRDDLAERYDDELYELDLRDLRQNFGQYADAFFLLSFIMLFLARRRLQQATRTGNLPEDNDEIVGHLERALEVRDLEDELDEYAVPEGIEGILWHGADTDWEALEKTLSWTSAVRSAAQKTDRTVDWLDFAAAEHMPWSDATQVEKYGAAVEALRESWGELEKTLGLNRSRVERAVEHRRAGTDASWLKALAAQLEEWSANLDELREWSMYAKARGGAIDLGIEEMVGALESGELDVMDVPAAAERGVLDWWTGRVIDQEPVLREFSELEHERLIEKFRERDRRSFQLARQEVRARVSSRIPDVDTASVSSEIGTLLREIQKKSKHKPIREVFDRIDNLLPRIAPCMLMSPMSVAQYLSTNPVDFDLVIFDEASQIPPWNALGSISRPVRGRRRSEAVTAHHLLHKDV
ncbi:MAG: AAA domain-containing protein, partial [Bradymonadaceae bacterium]